MTVLGDGIEAMAFLRLEGKYAGATRPDLILLDLNLPKKDGREVLAERKDQVAICFTLHYNININTKSSVRYGKPMRCHRVVLMFTRVRSVSEGEMPCEIR
jgi:response regulator of citrate/malate metabolism